MKKIKKLLSLLMTVCMVTAVVPTMAFADTEPTVTPDVTVQTFEQLKEAVNTTASNGSKVIGIDGTIEITQTINIDSNKKITLMSPTQDSVITRKEETKPLTFFNVKGGSELTLGCENMKFDLDIDGNSPQNASPEESISGTGIYVYNRGRLNMYDGVTVENFAATGSVLGAGIHVGEFEGSAKNTVFNMYGGEISNNRTTVAATGAGLMLYNATFNMYDGEITDNIAEGADASTSIGGFDKLVILAAGGGILAVKSVVNTGNIDDDDNYNGKPVISGNRVEDKYSFKENSGFGGGIASYTSTFNISDTLIKNNFAGPSESNEKENSGYGGGLALDEKSIVHIKDSKIINNESAVNGGGIYYGTPFVKKEAYGLYTGGKITVKDNMVGEKENNIYLDSYMNNENGHRVYIIIDSKLDEESSIGITHANPEDIFLQQENGFTKKFTSYNTMEPWNFFTSDDDDYVIYKNYNGEGQLAKLIDYTFDLNGGTWGETLPEGMVENSDGTYVKKVLCYYNGNYRVRIPEPEIVPTNGRRGLEKYYYINEEGEKTSNEVYFSDEWTEGQYDDPYLDQAGFLSTSVYAKWEDAFKLSLDLDGGQFTEENEYLVYDETTDTYNTDVLKDESVNALNIAVPEKEGYDFVKWVKVTTDENGNTVEEDYDLSAVVTEDLQLKAVWKEKIYDVKFVLNGAKWTDERPEFVPDAEGNPVIKVVYDDVVLIPSNPETDDHTLKFDCWADENGNPYDFEEPVKGALTLYPSWVTKEMYNVTFDTAGGKWKDNSEIYTENADGTYTQTVYEGDKAVSPVNPSRNGYDFREWLLDGTEYDFNTIVSENITLEAEWKKIKDDEGHGGGDSHELPEKPHVPEEKPETKPQETYDVPELVKDDHFAYMSGYPDGTFAPDRNMTRAEVAVMFSRLMADKPEEGKVYVSSFSDVMPFEWYYNAVAFMEQFGIINGYPDGTFRPNEEITRAEFATIASKFDELKNTGSVYFTDLPADHWAESYISMAYNRGWISGYPDGSVKPDRFITRAEVVSITNRMLERYGDENFIDNNTMLIKNFSDVMNNHWAYYQIAEAANAHDYVNNGKEIWTGIR